MPGQFPPGMMPPGMQALQAAPRPPTSREIAEAKRNKRLGEIITFAANALQNSIRSGSIVLLPDIAGDGRKEFGDQHIAIAFERAASFFEAVDEVAAVDEDGL